MDFGEDSDGFSPTGSVCTTNPYEVGFFEKSAFQGRRKITHEKWLKNANNACFFVSFVIKMAVSYRFLSIVYKKIQSVIFV